MCVKYLDEMCICVPWNWVNVVLWHKGESRDMACRASTCMANTCACGAVDRDNARAGRHCRRVWSDVGEARQGRGAVVVACGGMDEVGARRGRGTVVVIACVGMRRSGARLGAHIHTS